MGEVAKPTVAGMLAPQTFQELQEFSQRIANSEFVPKCFRGKPAEIAAAVIFGAELGLSTMQAIRGVQVINGQPAVYGDTLLAICQSHPRWGGKEESYREAPKEKIEQYAAICTVRRHGEPDITVMFSVGDAKRAHLWEKQGPWSQYPKRMLMMRARSFALRDQFADALRGIILAEEAEDYPVGPMRARDVTPETRTRPQAGSLDEVVAQRRGQAAPPAGDPAGQDGGDAELPQEQRGEDTGRGEPEDDEAEQHGGDDTGGDDTGDETVDPGTGEVSTSPPAGLAEQTTIECVIGNRAMYVAPDVGARHLLEHCTRVGSVAEIDKALERNRSWLDAATLDRIAELRAGRASATTAKGGKR